MVKKEQAVITSNTELCCLFLTFSVHSSLGYKDAVKSIYERKLQEARTEAQQDPQYLLHGDVSRFQLCISMQCHKCSQELWLFHFLQQFLRALH